LHVEARVRDRRLRCDLVEGDARILGELVELEHHVWHLDVVRHGLGEPEDGSGLHGRQRFRVRSRTGPVDLSLHLCGLGAELLGLRALRRDEREVAGKRDDQQSRRK
jgi:hypothetical protein